MLKIGKLPVDKPSKKKISKNLSDRSNVKILTEQRIEKKTRKKIQSEIICEKIEYLNRSMPGLPANQFTGKPISPDSGRPLLEKYTHTKTPNRHVDAKFLKKRDAMKERRIVRGNMNQIIEDSHKLTNSENRKVSFHHLATEFLI